MNENIKQTSGILYLPKFLVNTINLLLIHFLLCISRNALHTSVRYLS